MMCTTLACSFDQCRQLNFFINFKDGEDFIELLGIFCTKLVVYHSLSKLTFTGLENMAGQVGQDTWTRPDPTRQGLDPTRRSCQYSGPDPTRPDPRIDPTQEQL